MTIPWILAVIIGFCAVVKCQNSEDVTSAEKTVACYQCIHVYDDNSEAMKRILGLWVPLLFRLPLCENPIDNSPTNDETSSCVSLHVTQILRDNKARYTLRTVAVQGGCSAIQEQLQQTFSAATEPIFGKVITNCDECEEDKCNYVNAPPIEN